MTQISTDSHCEWKKVICALVFSVFVAVIPFHILWAPVKCFKQKAWAVDAVGNGKKMKSDDSVNVFCAVNKLEWLFEARVDFEFQLVSVELLLQVVKAWNKELLKALTKTKKLNEKAVSVEKF